MPNIPILLQLARVVRDAPEDLFHMRAVVEQSSCGTARCALGWAIVDPWFQANTDINKLMSASYHSSGMPSYFRQTALHKIFDLSEKNFDILFGLQIHCDAPPHAVSKQEVLDNIQRLIDGLSPVQYELIKKLRSYPAGS